LPKEYGRIRSVAFVKDTYVWTNIEDPAEWEAAIQNGDVVLIPKVHGSLAEPSEQVGPGYGDTTESILGFDFALTYYDPNYADNCDFYNALLYSQSWRLVYKSSSKGHATSKTVTIIPKPPIEDDLNAEVVWVVQVKWKDSQHACPFDFPASVLVCYELT
jgi:hypothetical protein